MTGRHGTYTRPYQNFEGEEVPGASKGTSGWGPEIKQMMGSRSEGVKKCLVR